MPWVAIIGDWRVTLFESKTSRDIKQTIFHQIPSTCALMILPFNHHVWTSKNLDKCRQMNDYNMTKHVNSRALAGRSMWGTMAKARLLQKTFTLLFCSFKFCSWFSTRKKAKLPSKTFLLHHHLLFLHQDSRRESLPKILQRFPYLSPSFLYQQEIWKEKVFFPKKTILVAPARGMRG